MLAAGRSGTPVPKTGRPDGNAPSDASLSAVPTEIARNPSAVNTLPTKSQRSAADNSLNENPESISFSKVMICCVSSRVSYDGKAARFACRFGGKNACFSGISKMEKKLMSWSFFFSAFKNKTVGLMSNFLGLVPRNFLNAVPLDFLDRVPADFLRVVPHHPSF